MCQKGLENQIIGFLLAFSCGTFILIALSDLLPEVQFHRHNRVSLFLVLVFGIVLMGGIAAVGGAPSIEENKHEESPGKQEHHEEDHDHKPEHHD